jgi:hypothetical protein
VDPDDSSLLFVGVGKSLLRSGDGGLTWQEAYHYVGGVSEQLARWLVNFDRANDRILMVFGFGCCRLLSSADRGLSWRDAGINATHVAVDAGGAVFVVDPSFTRVYVGDATPQWREVRAHLPLAP